MRQVEAIPAETNPAVIVAGVLSKHDGDRIGELSVNAGLVRTDAGGRWRWRCAASPPASAFPITSDGILWCAMRLPMDGGCSVLVTGAVAP